MGSFFSKLGAVMKGVFPILAGVAGFFFPQIPIAGKIISALPGLITAAEGAFGDGTGPIKKAYVMDGAEQIVATMTDLSTGGQKELWEKIAPLTSTIVDGIVAGVNGLSDEPVFDVYANMKNGL
jgi:hypothetical protein